MTDEPQIQVQAYLDADKLSWEAGDIAVSAEMFDALGNGAIQWVGELARVDIAPGDIAVLMVPEKLSLAARARVVEQMSDMLKLFPGVKVIVLDGGAKIGVLHPEVAS